MATSSYFNDVERNSVPSLTPRRPRNSLRSCWQTIPTRVRFTAILLAITFVLCFKRLNATLMYNGHSELTTKSSLGVYNFTLGFGAIILLSLPDRTDRQDAVSLISSMSGIQITKTIAAVRGENLSERSKPFGRANELNLSDGYWGSWRTHLDAFKYVVDNRIETALIFEDDVDWDPRIKAQLDSFSKGISTSSLLNHSKYPITPAYPYGTDWDIMHLGSVIIRPARQPFDKIHTPFIDPYRPVDAGCPGITMESTNDGFCWEPFLQQLGVSKNSRTILPTYNSIGLAAIAVTYEGAQRLLYELSWRALEDTLDYSIHGLLIEGRIRGLTVLPPFFSVFKTSDPSDSDIFLGKGEKHSNLEGKSIGLERSARLALSETLGIDIEEGRKHWSPQYWEEAGFDLNLV